MTAHHQERSRAAERLVELSHPIVDGMQPYPGLPRPRVRLHLDHERSRPRYRYAAEFAIGVFEFVGNVGTYLDSPFHRLPDGEDISQLPLDRLVDLPTTVLDARTASLAGRELVQDLSGLDLRGRAVWFRTGWDRHWGTDHYWQPGPYLSPVTVEQLVEGRPALVGVDFWNVDDPNDPARPAHTGLLSNRIPIVEHLRRVGDIHPAARSFVVPLAVVGAPSFPVRAFAINPST